MNRLFLALLALFAGIAAQVTPAEARVRGATEIGSVQAQRAVSRAAATVLVLAVLRTQPLDLAASRAPIRPVSLAAPTVVAVRIGSDRRHE